VPCFALFLLSGQQRFYSPLPLPCALPCTDLFVNTKRDLGPCEFKHHEEHLRDELLKEPAHVQLSVETRFVRYLEQCVRDLERVLARARVRMEPEDAKEKEAELARKDRVDQLAKVNDHIESLRSQVWPLAVIGDRRVREIIFAIHLPNNVFVLRARVCVCVCV
jgi:hypothetical protein